MQAGAAHVQFDDEGVVIVAVVAGVVARAETGREVRQHAFARDVGLAGAVHGNGTAIFIIAAAEEGGVAQTAGLPDWYRAPPYSCGHGGIGGRQGKGRDHVEGALHVEALHVGKLLDSNAPPPAAAK